MGQSGRWRGFDYWHRGNLRPCRRIRLRKTTVGKLVLRLIEATSGDIRFQGRNIRDLDKKELRALRKEMQIIFRTRTAR